MSRNAPPIYSPTSLAQVGARLHDLRETDEEYEQLSTQFQATIHGMRPDNTPQLNNVRILKIQRIENLQLWQSYAAKKASMLLRAKKEGIDPIEYERSYLWHGTNAGVVENIYQQVECRAKYACTCVVVTHSSLPCTPMHRALIAYLMESTLRFTEKVKWTQKRSAVKD